MFRLLKHYYISFLTYFVLRYAHVSLSSSAASIATTQLWPRFLWRCCRSSARTLVLLYAVRSRLHSQPWLTLGMCNYERENLVRCCQLHYFCSGTSLAVYRHLLLESIAHPLTPGAVNSNLCKKLALYFFPILLRR
jgi:hypothetical protein